MSDDFIHPMSEQEVRVLSFSPPPPLLSLSSAPTSLSPASSLLFSTLLHSLPSLRSPLRSELPRAWEA
eukprot:754029-Hanusia_phi.AAC.2